MNSFSIKEAGPAPLISALCDEIGLPETINNIVKWDETQCFLSPGTHVKALIINILCGRKALYRVEEFYEEHDLELLFGKPCNPSHFNDDVLTRTLDKVSAAGSKKVFSTVVAKALAREQVNSTVLHGDTTSKLVYGEYEDNHNQLSIDYGFSKDKRPDLKQYLYGLLTTKEGIPFFAEVRDGNLDDKTWNKELIETLKEQMSPEKLANIIYVADSAAVTQDSLDKFAGLDLKFISRLPNTYSLTTKLIERAWEENNWQEVGPLALGKNKAVYRLKEFDAELYGREFRFVVVHSSQLDKRKLKSLNRRLEKERGDLEKAALQQQKLAFACEADAKEALARFVKDYASPFFPILGKVELVTERVKRAKRGRPAKGELPKYQEVYKLQLEIGALDQDRYKQEQERLSCFVLISSVPKADYTSLELLQEYKQQSVVENRFKFIKSPFFVGSMYVQRTDRLEALSYIVLMALLVYSLLERRVRLALRKESEPLVVQGKVKTFTPTGNRILELLGPVKVLNVQTEGKTRRELPDNYRRFERVLRLAGFSLEIYKKPPG